MKLRNHFGKVSYYMLVILGLSVVCTCLVCVLACIIRQLYRFSSRRQRSSSSPRSSRSQGSDRRPGSDRRAQLPNYSADIHGPVQTYEGSAEVLTVQAYAVPQSSVGSSSNLAPTPSFLPPLPRPIQTPERHPDSQETLGSILKKQTPSPERAQHESMVSDESSSIWGAWNGADLTDEQIDMMVREAEAKQRQERLRQQLVDEGRLDPGSTPARPWWKPEGVPRLSPQPSSVSRMSTGAQSSVPTLLPFQSEEGGFPSVMSGPATTPAFQGFTSSGLPGTPPSDSSQRQIQGVSMLRPTEAQRPDGKSGVFSTPKPRQRWSLGSDGPQFNAGNRVTLHSPDRVEPGAAPQGRDLTPPHGPHPSQVTTPGKWQFSPNNQNRSLTPPPLPGELRSLTPPPGRLPGEPLPSAPPRPAQPARPRSLGVPPLPSVPTRGKTPPLTPPLSKTPPQSNRSSMVVENPSQVVLQQSKFLDQWKDVHQQYGSTPPPTPPSLIRGGNGPPAAVLPVWRSLTPPTSARLPDPPTAFTGPASATTTSAPSAR